MRIGIVGAGAMGQLFGAHLIAAGHEVVLIDVFADIVREINRSGIRVQKGEGGFQVSAVAALSHEVTRPVELLMVFTKAMHSATALDSVAHIIGDRTLVLSLQNGLGNEQPIVERVGAHRALVGMTDYPADRVPAGIVTAETGHVVVGGVDAVSAEHAAGIAALLDDAGMNATASDDVFTAIWEKAIFNAVFNTISAATGLTVGAIGREPEAQRLFDQVLTESLAAAEGQGVPVDAALIRAKLRQAAEHHGEHRTSMLADLEAGRPTEIEAIGGAVSRLAGEAGIAVPTLSALCDVVRLRSRAG